MIPVFAVNSIEELYDLQEPIGEGAYSLVYKAFNKETKEVVALKVYKELSDSDLKVQILQEVKTLRKLNHPNLIKLNRVFELNKKFYLEYPFMEQTLLQFYEEHKKTNQTVAFSVLKDIIRQIASGLAYLHGMGLMHRDLKPENILINSQGTV